LHRRRMPLGLPKKLIAIHCLFFLLTNYAFLGFRGHSGSTFHDLDDPSKIKIKEVNDIKVLVSSIDVPDDNVKESLGANVYKSLDSLQSVESIQTRGVIIYLAQFKNHSSYGGQALSSSAKLNKSLDLLYRHYVHHFPCDIIVFSGGDEEYITPELEEALSKGRPRLKFVRLVKENWSLPWGLQAKDFKNWSRTGFSVGYRHMMQWNAFRVWPYLANHGYRYAMRLDDDSYIHSNITYNLFKYMHDNGYDYGFRQAAKDYNADIMSIIESYLKENEIKPQQELNWVGYYNNFFIARVGFFEDPRVKGLLEVIDKSKLTYEQRMGDIIVHSLVVRTFLPRSKVHWFTDFTYEHMTLTGKKWPAAGCPQNGGVSRGTEQSQEDWDIFINKFRERFSGDELEKCWEGKIVKETLGFVGSKRQLLDDELLRKEWNISAII